MVQHFRSAFGAVVGSVLAFAGFSPPIVGQGQPFELELELTYGGEGSQSSQAVLQTRDDGFLVVGNVSWSNGQFMSARDLLLLRLDVGGAVVWQRTYGEQDDGETGSAAVQTPDGGYLVLGNHQDFRSAFGPDLRLMQIDAVGAIVWEKTFEREGMELGVGLQPTADGGYLLVGQSEPPYDPNARNITYLSLWKVDAVGELLWQRNFGNPGDYWYPAEIQPTPDGGFVVVGGVLYDRPTPPYSRELDVLLLSLDVQGEFRWQRLYDFGAQEYGGGVLPLPDGGYAVAGSTGKYGEGFDPVLFAVDGSGALTWQRIHDGIHNVGSYYFARGLAAGPDGGFVVAGDYNAKVSLLKTDAAGGSPEWHFYGASSSNFVAEFLQARDRSYVAVGATGTVNSGITDLDVYLLKTVPPPVAFRRGDANADGDVDISDAVATLTFLFLGGIALPCVDAADSNDSGDLDISDPIYTLGFLFTGANPAPPPPWPLAGLDPSDDRLTCERYEP